LIAYPLLAATATIESAPQARTGRGAWPWLWLGIPIALVGYPIGCALLGHKPYQAPPDSLSLETVALAGVVAPVEELTWGRQVEPRLGIALTAALFAAKHVVIDGKWRRVAGLALFWIGLGLVRRRSPMLALGVHMTANASGVLLGHLAGRDSF
jgi:membrane protease YdiL (CAAX protease family)